VTSRYMSLSVRLSSVCNVCLPTHAIKIFNNVSSTFPISDLPVNFYRDHAKGTLLSVGLNARGVAKYSDFGPFEGYILETMQDMI